MPSPLVINEIFLIRLQDENCEVTPAIIACCDTEEYAKKCVLKLNPVLEKHKRNLRFVIQKQIVVSDPYGDADEKEES